MKARFALLFVVGTLALGAAPPEVPPLEAEARAFLTEYAKELKGAQRQALVERYHPQGHFSVGHGVKEFVTREANRSFYLERWMPPTAFAWRDLSFEPAGPDAVVVIGLFDWGGPQGSVQTVSYTSLLQRVEGRLRIRLEDESTPLPRAVPAPPAKKK